MWLLISMALGQQRIVNGEEVMGTDFPEVVMVEAGGTCTGSLIHPEWVLTAAHCFDSLSIENVPDGNASVFFGNNVNGPGERIQADRVYIHPTYWSIGNSPNAEQPSTDGTRDDIALIHLAEPSDGLLMGLNAAEVDDSWIGFDITFIGYGVTAFQGSGSGVKRFTSSFVNSYDAYDRLYAFDPEDGRSTCQGDSGGPGVIYDGAGYLQVSVTAFGTECGTSPGGHMRVHAYIDWIRSILVPEGADITTVAVTPPDFICNHQLDPESENSIALGVIPMDLRCEVYSNNPENITGVVWGWGDGTTEETTELRANHVYDTQGVYNLSACMTLDQGGTEVEHCVVKTNHVNACGIPNAEFDAIQGEGLHVDLTNRTPLRAYTCISNATWEVYEGDGISGEPIKELSGWEPDLDFTEEGPGEYTIVLNVGGLGGTGGATTTMRVTRAGGACATTPPWSTSMWVAPLLLVGWRRRR